MKIRYVKMDIKQMISGSSINARANPMTSLLLSHFSRIWANWMVICRSRRRPIIDLASYKARPDNNHNTADHSLDFMDISGSKVQVNFLISGPLSASLSHT